MTARGTELTKSINFETDSLISSCSEKTLLTTESFSRFQSPSILATIAKYPTKFLFSILWTFCNSVEYKSVKKNR